MNPIPIPIPRQRGVAAVALLLALAAGWPSNAAAAAKPAASKPATSPAAKPEPVAAGVAVAAAAKDSVALSTPPELFLAWRAPHGTPGALRDVELRGSDAARPETLYLSFDPMRDSEKFYGVDATLVFRAASGDTLGSLWRFGGGTMNRRNVQIEFPTTESGWGCERPFVAAPFGAPSYRHGPQSGDLQVILAVPTEQAGPIQGGRRYCFARVIFPAGSLLDENDGQPVCIEWVKSDFAFALEGDGTTVLGRPVERFVSVNSPGVKVCAPFRQAPESWAAPGTRR